jgi:nitroreductase/NAD-dependent dihydropyrimidine dehydrogenase PreA subunit
MSDWVTIDTEKCNACGICALRCPFCFAEQDEMMMAYADEDRCILCGHCVSLCPTDAITHNKMDMANFESFDGPVDLDTETFIRFIRERRSHRRFKEKAIPREILEKLIDACRYAPTGSNVQDTEIIVVENPERRKKLSDLTMDFFEDLGGRAQETIESMKAEGSFKAGSNYMLEKAAQYKDRLGMARAMDFDAIFYMAPATIIFHAPVQTSAPKDNGVIASTTMGLLARTMGLEFTYIGLFELASKSYEPLIAELALPPGHEVTSCIIIGYPAMRFLRTVDRKQIKTSWE